MTKKNYSRDGFFRDQYRCVVDGGEAVKVFFLFEFSFFIITHHISFTPTKRALKIVSFILKNISFYLTTSYFSQYYQQEGCRDLKYLDDRYMAKQIFNFSFLNQES